VAVYFNAIGAFMKNLIGGNLNGRLVVTVESCRLGKRKMEIMKEIG